MKTTAIVDSSGLVSIFSPNDSNNILAIEVSEKISQKNQNIFIPSDVFSETLNIVGKKISHKIAYAIGHKLLTDKRFIILDTTIDIHQKALEKFKTQAESVSFTDCIVMAVADKYETTEIFGFDEAFHKNGYLRLGLD
ncbi:MAG TPA: PIN domain-containing protein [Patescibacteria group bacterium]|nr:PIN domain-containing protein [Patescibacteria group bacterium]